VFVLSVWVVAYLLLAPLALGVALGVVIDAWLNLRDLTSGSSCG
jgi:hypothetical protein